MGNYNISYNYNLEYETVSESFKFYEQYDNTYELLNLNQTAIIPFLKELNRAINILIIFSDSTDIDLTQKIDRMIEIRDDLENIKQIINKIT